MSTTLKLHFSGSDPSEADRRELNEAHQAYWDAREGGSNDDESVAASDFIEALMNYAGIGGGPEEDARECSRCGDEVQYLDSNDECDGCAALPKCSQCDEIATEFYHGLKQPVQFCESCEHNAIRGGWEPGK